MSAGLLLHLPPPALSAGNRRPGHTNLAISWNQVWHWGDVSGRGQDQGGQDQDSGGGQQPGYRPIIHGIGLGLALAVCWLLLSGYFQFLLLALGAASVLFCLWIAKRMDLIDHEGVPVHITWATLRYLPWLLWEIVKANIDVAKRVLHPDLPIAPSLFDAPVSQKTDLGQALYANSITLTPGTVSVDLDPGVIRVHALHDGAADGVLEGEMDKRVSAVEGTVVGTPVEGSK